MTDRDDLETEAALRAWIEAVAQELELGGLRVDRDAVLGLAGVVARAVVRPAAPLTTFLVGYAAGLHAAAGIPGDEAVRQAIAQATALAATFPGEPE